MKKPHGTPPPFQVRIGVSPIGWCNDDLPSLGGETPLETILREGAEIGYEGFELCGKFPREPGPLARAMARHGLAVVSGWYSGRLACRSLEEELRAVDAHVELLLGSGCDVMVYGEVGDSIQGRIDVPLDQRPRWPDADALGRYAERLTAFARHIRARGLRLAYHHHTGAYVESPADIDQLMAATGEEVGLLFDSGHVWLGGGDPVELLRRHIGRVCHVHCKDVRAAVARQAREQRWSFLDAVLRGVFTVPGDGAIDFGAIVGLLREHGYQGWLVVEAEQDPALAPSRAYAEKGYRTLRALAAQAPAGAA